METPNPKCNRCKCYWKPDETDIKPSGLYAVSCKKCREYQKAIKERLKCEHNKRKSDCRECDGSSFCEHNKQKSKCKECGGASICKHNKLKSRCRECDGSAFCIHDKRKSDCKNCGGASICPHDKLKSICHDCGGSQICPHDKLKQYCRDCKGSSFCIHDKLKSICRDCGGSQICPHDKQKKACKECKPQLYLINLQRRAIYRCLKSSNLEKTKPSIEYLGCSAEYFIEYFKKKMDLFNQFSEIEMTWNNIHIDHIKPVSLFNLDDEDEFLSCCHYTNLQPLLAEINLNKSDKWSEKDEIFWNENIKDKEYIDIYLPI